MRKPKGLPVNGWVILDKPQGLTSTQAVSRVKRAFEAQKAGHAGTLDPLATGILPIALGEATKTVPYVVDGEKSYRFTVTWGIETDTDDSEGKPTRSSELRPDPAAVTAILRDFIGDIQQMPPQYSAIKVDGARAYDLARDGGQFELAARQVTVHELTILEMCTDGSTSVFDCACGKGTYVRSLARDMGRRLGCYGHVTRLRRTSVGPFAEADAISLEKLEELGNKDDGRDGLKFVLRPVETALDDIPALSVSTADAARLMRGQAVLIRGAGAPILTGPVYATSRGMLVAVGEIRQGELHPMRVFNLNG
jgi:tRNA pseudouridine55 synthase